MSRKFDVKTLLTYGVMGLAVAGVIMLPSELIPSASAAAVVTTVSDYAVFGHARAEIESTARVTGGLIGSNATVSVGNNVVVPGVRAGNKVDDTSMATINGDIIAASTVTVGNASTVNGSIHSTNKVTDGANSIINGNVYSTKDFAVGNAMRVNGNVHTGANATDGSMALITGNVEVKDLWTAAATHTGYMRDKNTVPKGNPTAPNTFTPVTLPAATSFISGLSGDISVAAAATMTLDPGYYGDVTLGDASVINLATGRYYMTSLTSGNTARFNLDLSGGPIALFVEGNVNLGANLAVYVNGTSVSSILTDAKGGNMTIASKAAEMYLETHGAFTVGNTGAWFGAVYASGFNASLGSNAKMVGTLVSGATAKLRSASELFYVPWNGTLPPELAANPSSEGAYD